MKKKTNNKNNSGFLRPLTGDIDKLLQSTYGNKSLVANVVEGMQNPMLECLLIEEAILLLIQENPCMGYDEAEDIIDTAEIPAMLKELSPSEFKHKSVKALLTAILEAKCLA